MEEIVCSVCTDVLFVEDFVSGTHCGHVFHEKCLIEWINKSQSCPECRAECSSGQCRRLFFRSEPKPSTSNQNSVEKEAEYQEEIIKLRAEMASQKRDFETQLHAEVEIRQQMHKTNKTLNDENKTLKGKNKAMEDEIERAKNRKHFGIIAKRLQKMRSDEVAGSSTTEAIADRRGLSQPIRPVVVPKATSAQVATSSATSESFVFVPPAALASNRVARVSYKRPYVNSNGFVHWPPKVAKVGSLRFEDSGSQANSGESTDSD